MTETYNGYWSPVYGDSKENSAQPQDPYHPVYPAVSIKASEAAVYQAKAVQSVSAK